MRARWTCSRYVYRISPVPPTPIVADVHRETPPQGLCPQPPSGPSWRAYVYVHWQPLRVSRNLAGLSTAREGSTSHYARASKPHRIQSFHLCNFVASAQTAAGHSSARTRGLLDPPTHSLFPLRDAHAPNHKHCRRAPSSFGIYACVDLKDGSTACL